MTQPSDRPVVVVGASLAGVRTVQGLRDHGYEGQIILIGAEQELPYDRPPLSKDLLSSAELPEPKFLITADQLASLDVDVRLGTRASALDVNAKTITLSTGEELGYGTVVIATGSAALSRDEWGHYDGVHRLRTFEDCLALRADLHRGHRLAIVGAGFIGTEVASSARRLGLEVTILDNTAAPLTAAIGTHFAELTTTIHREAGIELRSNISIAGFEGGDRVRGVRLTDGTLIEADTVLVSIGARPAVDWLEGSGLELGNGVVCDHTLMAAPGVYAIGDVANFHNVLLDERMRVEHWTNAGEQATYVAKAIATGETGNGFGSLPFVWSEQFGIKIEIIGRPQAGDTVRLVDGSLADRQFAAVYERDGREVGAIAFNSPRSMFQLRRRFLAEFAAARTSPTAG